MNRKLFPLALGGLGIGTTEFVIMGLLPDVAASLNISIPAAGYLISAYALGVVVGAPVLVALSAKYPPKRILIGLMALFTLFNGLSALAPGFYTLFLARFFSGLPHGAFFGVGSIVASRLAKEGKQAQAISMMFAGLTVANLAMVPLVTFVGHHLNWRYAFGVVSSIGLLTILFLHFWLPALPSQKVTSLKEDMQFLMTKRSWLIIAITGIGFGGLFAWFSYIAPLMTQVTGFSENTMSSIMILAGAGMVVGNLIGGYMADHMPPAKASAILLGLMVAGLVCVFFFSGNQPVALALTFICGALSMSLGTPVNIMMIRSAKKSEMMAAAIMQAAFNIANSLGAFLGGVPLKNGYGYNYPSLVGALLALSGLGLCIVFIVRYKTVPKIETKQKTGSSKIILTVPENCEVTCS
ncbi:MFS transporter [Niabella soli]|uniref:Membrane protein n=1 Tax=Niabella soli DSM 19437 TaxID=929713 RepID=W0EYJ8_9BACT|nr:MFS transporter [Niabella soli]AHF15842.1 membrane protein [Niabella soli DSM 19437]